MNVPGPAHFGLVQELQPVVSASKQHAHETKSRMQSNYMFLKSIFVQTLRAQPACAVSTMPLVTMARPALRLVIVKHCAMLPPWVTKRSAPGLHDTLNHCRVGKRPGWMGYNYTSNAWSILLLKHSLFQRIILAKNVVFARIHAASWRLPLSRQQGNFKEKLPWPNCADNGALLRWPMHCFLLPGLPTITTGLARTRCTVKP